jgi:hypothetical protein
VHEFDSPPLAVANANAMVWDDTTIGGLYTVGRAAVGLCSNGYISGMSIGDGMFFRHDGLPVKSSA